MTKSDENEENVEIIGIKVTGDNLDDTGKEVIKTAQINS